MCPISAKMACLKCLILNGQTASYERHSHVGDFQSDFPSKFVRADDSFWNCLKSTPCWHHYINYKAKSSIEI